MNPTPSESEVSTERVSDSVTVTVSSRLYGAAVMAHVSDSDASVLAGDSSQEHLVLAHAANANTRSEELLEVKKKRLLEELESALVVPPKDAVKTPRQEFLPMPPTAMPNPVRPCLGLGIEVIDETALLETVPMKTMTAAAGPSKNSRRRAAKGEGGGAIKKQSRRHHKKTATAEEVPAAVRNGEEVKGAKYSRKEMEALRFVNVAKQRRFWKGVYASLQTAVAAEYDSLAVNRDPLPCLPNKKPIIGAVSCEKMDSQSQLMESREKVSPVDPSCSQSLMDEDRRSVLEEGNEDDDSEDDYTSIQRPAFLVDGEPNFDSGPPEDGWEYLRRVRWEAGQFPKVKVAKLDRCKLNKEQSAYMPKIPDVAKCPEHMLPLKEWEDVFLAEFSSLRANLSCLEGSSVMDSSSLQPVHSSQVVWNNCGESASVLNRGVLHSIPLSIDKAMDQLTVNLTGEEDKDSTQAVETGSKTCINQTSPPLLSVILGMDSVARVSMLLKRINSLESANTITRNDCMWLFALCATVDAPLHGETSAALRSLLRKCASIRAEKAELDEEVVMLNILATIAGRYFGQSET